MVPVHEITFTFVRASGPGGQRVNKTASKVQARWNVDRSQAFSAEEKQRIKTKLAHRLTQDHDLIVACEEERSQTQNKARAIRLMQLLVLRALLPDIPRVPTQPTRSSQRKRLATKKKRSAIKQERKHEWEE